MAAGELPAGSDAGQVWRRAQPQALQPAPADIDPLQSERSEDAPRAHNDVIFPVRGYQLEGVSQRSWSRALQHMLKAYVREDMTLAQLHEAARAVSRWYRAHGYIMARAFVPPQNIGAGDVRLVVQEGYLDPDAPVIVHRSDHSKLPRFHRGWAAAIVRDALDEDTPVQRAALENALLRLNDMPGVRAEAKFVPGSTAGTTRLDISLEDQFPISVYAAYDTHGAALTGRSRYHGGFSLQNLTGYGDQWRIHMSATRENYLYGYAAFNMPLGSSGLRLEGGYGELRYDIGGAWALLQAGGNARSWNVNAYWPLLRQRKQSFALMAGHENQRLRNHLSGITTSDRTLTGWHLGVQAWQVHDLLAGGQWSMRLDATQGRLDLSALPMILMADQGPWGAHMHGQFRTVQGQARLYQTFFHSPEIALELEGEGQWANRNLDGAAKFQLGGAEGVRAYPSGEGAGDEGWRGRATLHWLWRRQNTSQPVTVGVSAFYDHGVAKAFQLMPGQTASNGHSLSGWGIGVMASIAETLNVTLHHARRLGRNPFADAQGLDSEGGSARTRYWLSVAMRL